MFDGCDYASALRSAVAHRTRRNTGTNLRRAKGSSTSQETRSQQRCVVKIVMGVVLDPVSDVQHTDASRQMSDAG